MRIRPLDRRTHLGEGCLAGVMVLYSCAVTLCLCGAVALGFCGAVARAQKTANTPATDSAAQASSVRPAEAVAPVTDSAAQASPVGDLHRTGVWIAPHTALRVTLAAAIDSGQLKNGDTVHATLAAPVSLAPRGSLPEGSAAELTVIETLPAGRISAAGEFSLQVLRVGSVPVSSDTLTYRGQPGHKDLPDSAPAVGTNAGLPAGAELVFHVQPPPAPASGSGRARGKTPGSVNGVAPGDAPPPNSSGAQQQPIGANSSRQGNARVVQPADTTLQPAQPTGEPGTAPNQPAPPAGAKPADSTQPR